MKILSTNQLGVGVKIRFMMPHIGGHEYRYTELTFKCQKSALLKLTCAVTLRVSRVVAISFSNAVFRHLFFAEL